MSRSLPRTFPDLLPIFLCFPPVAPRTELTSSYYSPLCPLGLSTGLSGGLKSPLAPPHLVALRRIPRAVQASWHTNPQPLTQSPGSHRARQHSAVVKTVTSRVRACGSTFLPTGTCWVAWHKLPNLSDRYLHEKENRIVLRIK